MALTKLHSTRDFFRIWFTWKIQASILFLVVVGLVMAFSYVSTPVYKSSAKILLLPRTSEGAIIFTGTDEKRISPVSVQDLNTEIELLTSDDVIKDTVRSFAQGGLGLKLGEKPWYNRVLDLIKKAKNEILLFLGLKDRLSRFDSSVQVLKSSLKVEPVAMSNIVLVILKAERPKAAAVVLNRLLEVYIRHHDRVFTKEEGVEFFDEQSVKYREKLEGAEKGLKEFQKKHSIVDLKAQNSANIELLVNLTQEMKLMDISIDETQSIISMLRAASSQKTEDILITKEIRTIPSIVELEKNIAPLLVKRGEILKSFTPSSREYRDITDQIDTLRAEIRNEIIKAIKTDELELEAQRIKKKSLKHHIASLQQEANRLNEKERMLNELERDVEIQKNNYLLYTGKTEDARIYGERAKHDLANVSIADKASVPAKPFFPNRPLMFVISVIVGFFASIGIPFFLEFLDHRFKTPGEVEDLLSLSVICALPETRD